MDKIEKYLSEAAKPKWANDPYGFKRELSDRLKKVADQIEDIWVSEDRYYPGFEQNKQHYTSVNRQLAIFDKAVFKLETEALKAGKIK